MTNAMNAPSCKLNFLLPIPIDLIFIEVKNSILSSNLKPDSYKIMTFLVTFSYENRIDDA